MSNLTYFVLVPFTPQISLQFPTNGVITATLTNPSTPAVTSSIAFHANGPIDNGASASITAAFPPPPWSLTGSPVLDITFDVWPTSTSKSSFVVNGVTLVQALASASSTSSPSITSPTSSAISGPSTLSSASSHTKTGTASSQTHQSAKNYSVGELAGAAVGCLVGGLLIAGLLAFFFLRRRSKARNRRLGTRKHHELHGESLLVDTKGGALKGWEKELPQPDSDKTLGQLASRTLDEVEMFVEEFYVDKQTSFIGAEDDHELSAFDSPHLLGPVTDLLRTASTPTVLIKHCIAVFLLQKIDSSNHNMESLLPREYITPQVHTSNQDSRQELSQIRVLMAHMLPDPGLDAQYNIHRDQVITNAAQQIELAFRPWARGDASKRRSALDGVAIHLSELGIKLFAQPSSFRWQWKQSNSHSGHKAASKASDEVAMLPGLDKITGQRGELLDPPICLVKPRWGNWGW